MVYAHGKERGKVEEVCSLGQVGGEGSLPFTCNTVANRQIQHDAKYAAAVRVLNWIMVWVHAPCRRHA